MPRSWCAISKWRGNFNIFLVFSQITDIYVPLSVGGTVYFAQPDVLKVSCISLFSRQVKPFIGCIPFDKGVIKIMMVKNIQGSLAETLREVRPTTFFGVPRVWEKIFEKMQAIGKQTTGIKKTIATWFVKNFKAKFLADCWSFSPHFVLGQNALARPIIGVEWKGNDCKNILFTTKSRKMVGT